ncbi:DUF1345 domain-containing protein [Roseomonas rosulenta]|uniref:DUF1345 domain-containing protein n=1 Tax=Roseomonas rosulenta TaxID=2748667 RepID=UPI0018DEF916|nr:DUF1345 domain-containing protein [Roseomonas rosulenta]
MPLRRTLRHRPSLVVALAVLLFAGMLARLILGYSLRPAFLVGWCAGAATHAALLVRHLLVTPPERMRDHAALLEDSRWAIIGASLTAAFAALLGVVTEIGGGAHQAHSWPLGVATITLSWIYLHVLFAVHYAHAYWLAGGGLEFPGGREPDCLEFLYLSFTVGMTAQVSDVTTSSPAMRRMVLAHGLAAFTFNAAILGVAVNLLAGSATG